MSMHPASVYMTTVLDFQTQQRNEKLSTGCTLPVLTMTEVKMTLLLIDASMATKSQAHQARSSILSRNYSGNKSREYKNSDEKDDMDEAKFDGICYYCKKPGHIKKDCPLLKRENKDKEKLAVDNVESEKETKIVLVANTDDTIQISMVNAERGLLDRNMRLAPP